MRVANEWLVPMPGKASNKLFGGTGILPVIDWNDGRDACGAITASFDLPLILFFTILFRRKHIRVEKQ
jgi:hypothetical protein